jgi:ElaA protein
MGKYMITWHCELFNELTLHKLYDLLKIRCDVFLVEQNCPYPELDNIDKLADTQHLYAMQDLSPIAYTRIIAPDVSYPGHSSIGRVLVVEKYRKDKLGHRLLKQAIQATFTSWPNVPIKIGAQVHLEKFYQSHGFVTSSAPYLEDGIEHISMILTP